MIEMKRHPFPYGKFFTPFFPSGGRVLSGDGSAGTGMRHPDAGTALCPGLFRDLRVFFRPARGRSHGEPAGQAVSGILVPCRTGRVLA